MKTICLGGKLVKPNGDEQSGVTVINIDTIQTIMLEPNGTGVIIGLTNNDIFVSETSFGRVLRDIQDAREEFDFVTKMCTDTEV